MPGKQRSFWGWGYEGEGITEEHRQNVATLLAARLGCEPPQAVSPPRLDEITLPAPRLKPPAALAAICTDDPHARASHTYGKSFRDVVRALRRDFFAAPDLVATPG